MSELQKWITAISGAVIGQIAVLGFFYLFVARSASGSLQTGQPSYDPKEVTIMLSQLVEERAPEPEEPEITPGQEEETAPEELPPEELVPEHERQFVDTDSSTAQLNAPENATFESHKNTFATTEFLPDPNLPQVAGPTLRGREEVENLSLANQQYIPGEVEPNPVPAPPPSSMAAAPAVESIEQIDPVEEVKDTSPSEIKEPSEPDAADDKLADGEAEETKPGEADTPPDRLTELLTQPETEKIGDVAQMATSTTSFLEPENSASSLPAPSEPGDVNQEAIAQKPTEEFDEPGAPEEEMEIKAIPVESGKAEDLIKLEQAAKAQAAEIQKQLNESMFNPSFLAHQRENIQNGNVTKLGEGSVDAESSEVGKYKKQVRDAIGKTWHEYRQDRAADVSLGFLKLTFFVSPNGKVTDLIIAKKETTEMVTEFTLRAIYDAKLPKMSKDVAAEFGPKGMKMHYNIAIY